MGAMRRRWPGGASSLCLLIVRRGAVGKRPRAEVMDEQIPTHRQRETGFAGFGAEDVSVEEAHVGPLFELALVGHAAEDFAFEQEAEAGEAFGFEPFALVGFAVFAGKTLYSGDIEEVVRSCVMGAVVGRLLRGDAVGDRFDELRRGGVVRHGAGHADGGGHGDEAEELVEPAVGDDGVVVEQDDVFAASAGDRFLDGVGNVEIGAGADDFNAQVRQAGGEPFEILGGAVERADVNEDQLERRAGVLQQAGDE